MKIKVRILFLSISIFITSCGGGSDNTVSESSGQKDREVEVDTSWCTTVHNKADLIEALESIDSFRPEPFSPYVYRGHWECTIGKFTETCGRVETPSNPLTRSSSLNVDGIRHELASTKTALLSLLSSAASRNTGHRIINDRHYPAGSIHEVTSSGSYSHPIWTINFCLPLVAQPTYKKNRK
ncbi:MAG: hypothetical protein OXB84_02150 [Halobacteriovoraceae bacterium]|nr:hypothetical protein [Halobacteriovoraceae bacterium]